MIAGHLGLGMRLGTELAYFDETREIENNIPVDKDNARMDILFFGPQNPFDGALLGLSVYVYFGGT